VAVIPCHHLGNYSHPVRYFEGTQLAVTRLRKISKLLIHGTSCICTNLKAAVLISWDHESHGVLAMQDVKQFYIMRFLLGAAEVRHIQHCYRAVICWSAKCKSWFTIHSSFLAGWFNAGHVVHPLPLPYG
jgi:hypothetical protein